MSKKYPKSANIKDLKYLLKGGTDYSFNNMSLNNNIIMTANPVQAYRTALHGHQIEGTTKSILIIRNPLAIIEGIFPSRTEIEYLVRTNYIRQREEEAKISQFTGGPEGLTLKGIYMQLEGLIHIPSDEEIERLEKKLRFYVQDVHIKCDEFAKNPPNIQKMRIPRDIGSCARSRMYR